MPRQSVDKSEVSAPEKPPATPAIAIQLNLRLAFYSGPSGDTTEMLHFVLKENSLSVSGFVDPSVGVPATKKVSLDPATMPGGVPTVFLSGLSWGTTLDSAQLADIATLVKSLKLIRKENVVLGYHAAGRWDRWSSAFELLGRIGDEEIQIQVDNGAIAEGGLPLKGMPESISATTPQVINDIQALQTLGKKLASFYTLEPGDILLAVTEFEKSSDSFSEWQYYALKGSELSRRYHFSGADGHRQMPAFTDGSSPLSAAQQDEVGSLLQATGLLVTKLALEHALPESMGTRYRLIANGGGKQARIAIDVITGETLDSTTQSLVDSIQQLKKKLDTMGGN